MFPSLAFYKVKCEILRSHIMREQALKQKTSSKVSLLHCAYTFSHRGSKTFCLLPANLATPGNKTKHNVSAAMFPSLARR